MASKETRKLEWKSTVIGNWSCLADDLLILVAEKQWRGKEFYSAAYVGSTLLYRSDATFDLEAAKRECIRQGAKAVRRLAREYAEIAERLGGPE